MENEIVNQLWEAFQVFNPILAASIVAVSEIVKSQIKDSPRWVTFAVGIVLTAIYYFIADGANLVQVIAPFLAAVFAYDFAVQPLKRSSDERNPPIGGGGGGPRP